MSTNWLAGKKVVNMPHVLFSGVKLWFEWPKWALFFQNLSIILTPIWNYRTMVIHVKS